MILCTMGWFDKEISHYCVIFCVKANLQVFSVNNFGWTLEYRVPGTEEGRGGGEELRHPRALILPTPQIDGRITNKNWLFLVYISKGDMLPFRPELPILPPGSPALSSTKMVMNGSAFDSGFSSSHTKRTISRLK